MSTRYRWFRVRIPYSDASFAAIVARSKFGNGVAYGFAVLAGDSLDGPSYRFLWRTTVTVTRLDDDGAPTTGEIESVGFTDFRVSEIENKLFLRIENPGRSVRELLNALELIFGMGFTAEPVQFDRVQPSTFFDSVTSSKLIGLKVAGAVVGDDLVARMEFASKEGMDPQKMRVLDGLKYKVDLAVFEVLMEGLRGQVSFTSSGMVKISGQIAGLLVGLIETDLPRFVAK